MTGDERSSSVLSESATELIHITPIAPLLGEGREGEREGKEGFLQSRIPEEGLTVFYPQVLHNGDDVLPFKLVVVIVFSEESPVAEYHTLNNWECTNTSLSLSSADVGSVNGRY